MVTVDSLAPEKREYRRTPLWRETPRWQVLALLLGVVIVIWGTFALVSVAARLLV